MLWRLVASLIAFSFAVASALAQPPAWVIPVRCEGGVVRSPRSLDFTPDGTQLVVRHAVPDSRDDRLLVYEVKTGKVVTSVTITGEPVMRPWFSRTVCLSAEGDRVVYAQGKGLRNGPLSATDPNPAYSIRKPERTQVFSPSFVWLDDKGKGAYVGLDVGGFTLEHWDFEKGTKRAVFEMVNTLTSVSGAALDVTACRLAIGFEEMPFDKSWVDCWTLRDKPTKVTISLPKRARSVALAPAGKVLVVGLEDGSIRWYDTETGNPVKDAQKLGLLSVVSLAFEPGGEYLACGTNDKRGKPNLFIVRVATGEVVNQLTADAGGVTAVQFSPKGNFLAAYGNSGEIKIWPTAALLKRD